MNQYDSTLQPLGFSRGDSSRLLFNQPQLPIGIVRDGRDRWLVTLYPASDPLKNGDDGAGILFYSLTLLPRRNDPEYESVYIPAEVLSRIPSEQVGKLTLFPCVGGTREADLTNDGLIPEMAYRAGKILIDVSLASVAVHQAWVVSMGVSASLGIHWGVATTKAAMGVA